MADETFLSSRQSPAHSIISIGDEDSDSTEGTSDQRLTGNNADEEKAAKSDKGNARAPAPRTYDPKVLLAPRGARKRDIDGDIEMISSGTSSKATTPADSGLSPPPANFTHMIEQLNNVQAREDQPTKRIKSKHDQEEDAKSNKLAFNTPPTGGTELGQYMKDQRKKLMQRDGTAGAIVDLTKTDDDDDDVILVSDSGDREICLGKLESASVLAYLVPSQRPGGFQGHAGQWPVMKVTLRRRPGMNNTVVGVIDPSGKEFGKMDVRTASALAPLMDGQQSHKMRIQARLETRKRRPGEQPHQQISESLQLQINIYAPRKMANSLGRYLGQRGIWLRQPLLVDRGIEYDNPQIPKAAAAVQAHLAARGQANGMSKYGSSTPGYVMRTVEEIRSDVQGMFNTLKDTEGLPEMDTTNLVITPLLKHQKQALHFMTEREKDSERVQNSDGKGDTGNEMDAMWKLQIAPNGSKSYMNVITGQSQQERPPATRGGILGDVMGLGKTLSILSLVTTTLNEAREFGELAPPDALNGGPKFQISSGATLLVAPLSTIANWEEQIKTHIKPKGLKYYIYHGPNRAQDAEFLAEFDLVITTYNILGTELDEKKKNRSPLFTTYWFRVVLDEGHMIREQSTRQSQAACALAAQRRWAVTGTPVQNRLDDLGALVKFLKVKPFDEKNGFNQYILMPFKNADPEILPKLRLLVDSITLRRLKDKIDLPPRYERIERLAFSDQERAIYDLFAQHSVKTVEVATKEGIHGRAYAHILKAILNLRLICAHGTELLSDEAMKLLEGRSASSAIDLGDDDELDKPALTPKEAFDMLYLLRESNLDICSKCNKKIGAGEDETAPSTSDIVGYMMPCYQIVCPDCYDKFLAEISAIKTSDNHMNCPFCDQYVRAVFFPIKQTELDADTEARDRVQANPRTAKHLGRYTGRHTKTQALIESLHESERWSAAHPTELPLKSVVFSGWTSHLDLIQIALDEAAIPYVRLDGSMSRNARTTALNTFSTSRAVSVMLATIGAGGVGLNLTSASRVYVMEPQFNPAAEAQAVDRVHRLGQKREVHIVKFIMKESFEEKMLDLQRKKRDLADLSMNRNALGRGVDKAEQARRRLEELRSLFR